MTETGGSFADEFEREEAKLVKQLGAIVNAIALEWSIEAGALRRWPNHGREGVLYMRPNLPICNDAAKEVERIQLELRRVTPERGIPKTLDFMS